MAFGPFSGNELKMGFDVFAINEEQENNYFRNNVWWWRPLWNLCYRVKAITEEKYENDKETALEIHSILEILFNTPICDDFIKRLNDEEEMYNIDLANCKEFSAFCKTSGGFRIC